VRRHFVIDFVQPQDVLVTKSSMLFIAHPDPVAETMATVANTTRRLGRMMVGFEHKKQKKVEEQLYLAQEDPLKATR
jgi:hypothetical protein